MGTISVSLPSDGSAASVSQYNTPITTIVNAINGNLDSSNISNVSGTKVTAGTLPGSALDMNAAGGWTPISQALTYAGNNGSKEFTVTAAADLTGFLSPGMKFKTTRGTTPSTQCMSFTSASSQYATKASPSGISFSSAYTCEAVINPTSYTVSNSNIGGRFDGTNGFTLGINSTGQLFARASSTTYQVTYQSVPLNTWTHVAATFSAGTFKTYINGTLVPSFLTGSGTSVTQAGSLQVGATNSTEFFNGSIYQFRIWSVAQSQANIQANMGITLTTATNLVFVTADGSFNDASGVGNNLTATNGPIATQVGNPFNAIEYANIRAISYSNPTTTITLYTGDAGTIPNQTLNTPFYSVSREPYGLPEVLNSKVLGYVIWGSNQLTTATATGTQLSGATITMTIPTNGKKLVLKATCYSLVQAAGVAVLQAFNGSTQVGQYNVASANYGVSLVTAPFVALAGSQTFSLDLFETSAGTCTWAALTAQPASFTVEET